jgi:hypothetical protein
MVISLSVGKRAVRSPNELTEPEPAAERLPTRVGAPASEQLGFTITPDLKHESGKTQVNSKTPGVHIAHPAFRQIDQRLLY